MGGPTPFGLDPAALDDCLPVLATHPRLRFRGLHVHLASGLAADAQVTLAEQVLEWALRWARDRGLPLTELNLGGGMAVDYTDPAARFDWARYGTGLGRLTAAHPGLTLRIEPGRALTAYAGCYAAQVLDVKRSHGAAFAVVHGGTHHLRTPAARGHDQPFTVVPVDRWAHPWPRPQVRGEPVTLVGQLCTPKDVLARAVTVPALRAGDIVVFALAGAYAWNISHHDFLMHPHPDFHYLPPP
jgi:diaminopimelate decarboxylase